jgi:hypothetical protein
MPVRGRRCRPMAAKCGAAPVRDQMATPSLAVQTPPTGPCAPLFAKCPGGGRQFMQGKPGADCLDVHEDRQGASRCRRSECACGAVSNSSGTRKVLLPWGHVRSPRAASSPVPDESLTGTGSQPRVVARHEQVPGISALSRLCNSAARREATERFMVASVVPAAAAIR